MRNFQDTFETRMRSFISFFSNLHYCTLTPHFLEENEIVQFVSFHYWRNQKYTSELHIY